MPNDKLKIMVASTVHGFSENLEAVYATLTKFGYEVWCSQKGTIPAHPGKSNSENCFEAAKNCDLFLGILRPYYGSGIIGATSITHEEIKTAVEEKLDGAIDGANKSTKRKLGILLKAIVENEGKRTPDYRAITNLGSERTMERYIDQLREVGFIEFRGKATQTGGCYLTKKLKELFLANAHRE